jgi:FKBP-type peptidyl-prolyl cis-trans isomerase
LALTLRYLSGEIFNTKYMIKKYFQSILLLLAVALMLSLASCDPSKKYEKREKASIQEYLSSHADKNFELKPSGLYYLEVLTGTGRTPLPHDSAFVMLKEMFIDETVYYSNEGTKDTIAFRVAEGSVIYGLDEGITFMKEGGKASLLIPSSLAFGSSGNLYGIGGYTPLLFDIQLVRVKPEPEK